MERVIIENPDTNESGERDVAHLASQSYVERLTQVVPL